MKSLFKLFVPFIILFSMTHCINAQKAGSRKNSEYYTVLSEALKGRYVADSGVAWHTDDLYTMNMNADNEVKLVYFVIDTAVITKQSETGTESLHIITHTNAYNKDRASVNDCHACATNIGYFVFGKGENGTWILERGNPLLAKAGSFGSENYSVSFQSKSEYEHLIFIKSSYTGMGQTTETTEIFLNYDLLMRIPTYDGGEVVTEKGPVKYEVKTSIKLSEDKTKLHISKSGTELDENDKLKKVSKNATYVISDLEYNTANF